MNSKSAGIYCITSKVNGKRYVGSSVRICKRWKDHLRALRNNKHHSQHLQNHYNKYGEDDLVFSILEVVGRGELPLNDFKQLLLIREQAYLDNWEECHFNCSPSAGNNIGLKRQGSKYYSFDTSKNRYIVHYHINTKQLRFGIHQTEEEAIKEVEYIKSLTEEELVNYYNQIRSQPNRGPKQGKGYYWNKSMRRWRVRISINNKDKHFGDYKTEQEAIDRTKQVKIELGRV